MSRVQQTAKHILGKGWYTNTKLAKELNITTSAANIILQNIRRSNMYETDDRVIDRQTQTKVISIEGYQPAQDKERALWRLAIFGEALTFGN